MAADKDSKDEEADTVTSPNYKGPDDDFPFAAFRTTGFIHLTLGLMVQFLAIIQLSMGPEHRDIFLQFAAAPLWCPIPVIAVGVLGICMSRKRYWEVRCMKVCFGVLSLLNAFLFMVVMGSLVGFYGFYYYSVSTYVPAEADDELRISESTGYTVMVTLVLVIAGVEVLVSFFSFFICCCCAHVKRPNEAKKPKPTPKSVPSTAAAAPVVPESSAAPVAAPATPMQYGIIVPPGPGAPPGAAAAVVLSPGPGAGYPPGTFMIPGASPPTAAFPPTPVQQQPTPADAPAPTAKDKKSKAKKEKQPTIRMSKKKDKKKKTTTPAQVHPEKSDGAPTFTIQVPEYMRGNPVTHGNGVPQGFISYPNSPPPAAAAAGASAYSSGSYASIPSLPTAQAPSMAPPPSFAPGYQDPSPAYDYYTNIPGM